MASNNANSMNAAMHFINNISYAYANTNELIYSVKAVVEQNHMFACSMQTNAIMAEMYEGDHKIVCEDYARLRIFLEKQMDILNKMYVSFGDEIIHNMKSLTRIKNRATPNETITQAAPAAPEEPVIPETPVTPSIIVDDQAIVEDKKVVEVDAVQEDNKVVFGDLQKMLENPDMQAFLQKFENAQ
jgi:hypothetical protein